VKPEFHSSTPEHFHRLRVRRKKLSKRTTSA
jgi:hypothetical protein